MKKEKKENKRKREKEKNTFSNVLFQTRLKSKNS